MKTFIPQLQSGDAVEGVVSEQLQNGDLIINFKGDLLRVANETRMKFAPGDRVALIVMETGPLRFRLNAAKRRRRSPGNFDVTI